MHVHIAIAVPPTRDADAPASNPAWLPRDAVVRSTGPETPAEVLAHRFGVSRQVDWPLAPLRAAAMGIDPGHHYWLAADPVTLVAGRDDVRVTGRSAGLTTAQAASLIAALNAHFAGDGLCFVAGSADHWFVRCDRPMRMATTPLSRAIDRPLRDRLPSGEDSGPWRRWQSEIEMLLHGHPANTGRADAGLPPVNGVWPSHGGVLPALTPAAPITAVLGDDGDLAALARHAQVASGPLPQDFAAAAAEIAGDGDLLISLAARDEARLLERWVEPARRALLRGRIAALTLLLDDGSETRTVDAIRPGWLGRFVDRLRAGTGAAGEGAR